MGYRLGVDLGTTFTSAAVFSSGWPTMVGLGNRAMQIPSVLFLKEDGEFLVGEAAERRAQSAPDRIAREFKRRLGDQVPILIGGSPQSPQALQARLLRWVVDQVSQREGSAPDRVTVTYPANWSAFKQDLLTQTLLIADVADAQVCTEPEAAATLYAARNVMAPGDCVAVYDLGGGTFDAAVLRKTSSGFELLGQPQGIEHLGGIDFDEAVFHHALSSLGDSVASMPDTPELTRALARLRRDCVEAKEALSSDTEAVIRIAFPGLTTSLRLARADFERMIGPSISDTVAAMRRVIRSAELEPSDLAAIVLTGGSSRIPLVSEYLNRAFDVPLALDTHPKHDIALGAALHGVDLSTLTSAPPPAASPSEVEADDGAVAAPPLPPPPAAGAEPEQSAPGPKRSKRRLGVILAVAVAVLLVIAGVVVVLTQGSDKPSAQVPPTGTISTSPPTTTISSSTPPAPQLIADNSVLVTVRRHKRSTLYSVNVDDNTHRALVKASSGSDTKVRLPTISPDRGSFIYLRGDSLSEPGEAWIQTVGDAPQPLLDATSPCTQTNRPAFNPAGTQLALICPDKATGVLGLYVVGLDGQEIRALSAGSPLGDPTWEGANRILFISGVGTAQRLFSIAADGSETQPTPVTTGEGIASHPDWNVTGGLLVLTTIAGKTSIWVSSTGQAPFTNIPGTEGFRAPSWSPDGKHIAYLAPGSNGKVALWSMNADGSSKKQISWPTVGKIGTPAWDSR